jgi:hypothetical protein
MNNNGGLLSMFWGESKISYPMPRGRSRPPTRDSGLAA